MIAECKADNVDHNKACGEAIEYAKNLVHNYDIIVVGVSGTTKESLKVETAVWKKDGSVVYKKNNDRYDFNRILTLEEYDKIIGYTERKELALKESLNEIKNSINWILYESGNLNSDKRMLILSACLLGLRDSAFRSAYYTYETEDILEALLSAVDRALKKYGIPKEKRDTMNSNFKTLEQLDVLINGTVSSDGNSLDPIKSILNQLHRCSIHSVFEENNLSLDVMGEFYNEFITHGNDLGNAKTGFVLTPRHICELFADLGELDETTKILDMCFGTGGFLVAGMQKEIALAKNDSVKINNIKFNNICGVELDGDRFTYGCVNMILRGDGQSNMLRGDCFDKNIKEEIKNKHCKVGFINPPYALKIPELAFVENMLDCLEVGGRGIAIIPSSCTTNKNGEYKTIRERILSKHTLEAVLSMPDQLFYPSASTVTCIMIFTSGKPHNSSRKTWFASCKDDGLVIDRRSKGRADINKKWQDIKEKWVNAFIDRDVIDGFSLKQSVTAENEWSYEAYAKTDFSGITEDSFKKVIKEYALFVLSQADIKMKNKDYCQHNICTCDAMDLVGIHSTIKTEFVGYDVGDFDFTPCNRYKAININGVKVAIALEKNYCIKDCTYANKEVFKDFDIIFVINCLYNGMVIGRDIKRSKDIINLKDAVDNFVKEASLC